jgi:toxin ParE1/3/4
VTRIEQTGRASDDFESAFAYLLERNPPAAQKLKLRIAKSLQLIIARPLLGRSRNTLHPKLRSYVIQPYVLFYVPTEDGIRIVRFLHGSRDIETMFDDQQAD